MSEELTGSAKRLYDDAVKVLGPVTAEEDGQARVLAAWFGEQLDAQWVQAKRDEADLLASVGDLFDFGPCSAQDVVDYSVHTEVIGEPFVVGVQP